MKLLLIASTVDDGTTSITHAFRQVLAPQRFIGISQEMKTMKPADLIHWCREIRAAAFDSDHVICLNHGGLILGGAFLPRKKFLSLTGMTNWTRAFPSRKKDINTRIHTFLYLKLLKRFDKIFAPPPDLREFFRDQYGFKIEPILLPPPYGEVEFGLPWSASTPVQILFIGTDFRRKGGHILLRQWAEANLDNAHLTVVTPNLEKTGLNNITHLNDIQARTDRHYELLSKNHIFILASSREAYGFAALEAMNFGQIVVTTRNAGIASLVELSGGIVEDTQEQAVAAAIELSKKPSEIMHRQKQIRQHMLEYRRNFKNGLQSMLSPSP